MKYSFLIMSLVNIIKKYCQLPLLPPYFKWFSICIVLLLILLLLLPIKNLYAWGFWGHKRINRMAVFTLPQEMFGFYKGNIDFITEMAVQPDKRRYVVEGEAPRHYIDLERYGSYPFDSLPRRWADAAAKYSEDTLNAYGIVPWHIYTMHYRLKKAFEAGDKNQILRLSADLGHYVADAHVPLHTTHNYNGHLTGQEGIHGFWESRLPELFGEGYNYFTGQAEYIKDPLQAAWEMVLESHSLVDSVLVLEKQLHGHYEADQKYSYEHRGNIVVKNYSMHYSDSYSKMLNGMVERRMTAAIHSVGSFWLTAWIDAGQPDLNKLTATSTDEAEPETITPIPTRNHPNTADEIFE